MGRIAIVFAGQGAQKPGMGKDWAEDGGAAGSVFAMADRLRPGTTEQCLQGDAQTLGQTINTQPCLFCADLSAALALKEQGIHPAAVAGFSLGEIPALAFAGMMTAEDAFRLVCLRAEAMQACAERHPGAMLAVLGMESAAVEAICDSIPDVYPANDNSPGQLVISGSAEGIARAREAVRAAGGKALPVKTSGPFHTPFMQGAAEVLASALGSVTLTQPGIPVYANRTGMPYEAPYAPLIASQVTQPVRWQQTVKAMSRAGIDTFVEVGVGKTLCGLVKRTLPDAAVYAVEDAQSLQAAVDALSNVESEAAE